MFCVASEDTYHASYPKENLEAVADVVLRRSGLLWRLSLCFRCVLVHINLIATRCMER